MLPRAATVGFLGASAIADSVDAHRLAFYLLLAVVPAAAVTALLAFGELVDALEAASASAGLRLQVLLGVLVLVLVIVGAAARAASLSQAVVPVLATAALLACFALILVQAGASAGTGLRRAYHRLRAWHVTDSGR
jgi:hypothetical protein